MTLHANVPLQKRVERVLVGSVDVSLGKQRPLGFLAVGKSLNLLWRAWLLRAKLVARYSDDLQALL